MHIADSLLCVFIWTHWSNNMPPSANAPLWGKWIHILWSDFLLRFLMIASRKVVSSSSWINSPDRSVCETSRVTWHQSKVYIRTNLQNILYSDRIYLFQTLNGYCLYGEGRPLYESSNQNLSCFICFDLQENMLQLKKWRMWRSDKL